jgi:16S rRNA (guanine966-N2)-methyltransferase
MNPSRAKGRPPGRIRIVAGAKRGHRIKVPPGEVRPTGERVREAVFDVLGSVYGLDILDLFAGSGAMGLEALSRGAASCVFVEAQRAAAAVLRENIASLGLEARSEVLAVDYATAAARLRESGRAFDLLFLDPPYRMLPKVEAGLEPLLEGLLTEDGLMVIEGPKAVGTYSFGEPVFDRVYGETRVVMISKRRDGR